MTQPTSERPTPLQQLSTAQLIIGVGVFVFLARIWLSGAFAHWAACTLGGAPSGFSADGAFAYGLGVSSILASLIYLAIQFAIPLVLARMAVRAGVHEALVDAGVGLRQWIEAQRPTVLAGSGDRQADAAAAVQAMAAHQPTIVAAPSAAADPLAKILAKLEQVNQNVAIVHGNGVKLTERIKRAEEANDQRFRTVSEALVDASSRIQAAEEVIAEVAAKVATKTTRSRTAK